MISTAKVASRLSGSKVGVIGALYGLITGVIALLAFTAFRLLSPIPLEFRGTVLYSILVAEIVCIGGTTFSIGLFFVVYRKYVSRYKFWIVSGVVFMLAGILYSIFYFDYYSFIIYIYLIGPSLPTIGPILFEFSLPVAYGSLLFASVLGAVAFFAGKPAGEPVEETVEN